MMARARCWVAAMGLFAATLASPAVPHFDLERLSLDPAARGSLVVGVGEVQPFGSVRLGASVMAEHTPLVLEPGLLTGNGLERTTVVAQVVRARATGEATLAAGILPRLEASVRVAYVWQDAADTSAAGGPGRPERSGRGAPAAGLRGSLLSQEAGALFNLAVGGEVLLPLGNGAAIAGQDQLAFAPSIELGHRFGGWLLGARVGGLLRRAVPLTRQASLGAEVNGAVVVATTGHPLRAELSARGVYVGGAGGATSFESAEVLAGARYRLGAMELFALGGPGLGNAPGQSRYRALLGLALGFGEDEAKAGPLPPPPPSPAAPPPVIDPCWPGQAHTPDQCPDFDDDGDGIKNRDDLCPLVPGYPEWKGCPTDKQLKQKGRPPGRSPGVADNWSGFRSLGGERIALGPKPAPARAVPLHCPGVL